MRYFAISSDFELKVAPKALVNYSTSTQSRSTSSHFMIHTLRDEEALGSFVPERYLEAYLNDEEFARTFPFTPLTLLCYNRQIKIGREDVKGGTLNIIPLLRRTLKIPITSYRFEGLSYCPERKSWFLSVEI